MTATSSRSLFVPRGLTPMFKSRRGPDGLHLFDRDSGINVLVDEVSFPVSEWSPAPRFVSIALTNACELECPYCYAPKHRASVGFDDVLEWVGDLAAAGCLGIGFGGGEPTLYPRFPDLCREVAGRTDLAVTMTTHGHQFTPALSRALAGRVHFVRVSMDGVGATYERLRGRSFASFAGRLAIVRETAPFGINYVVNGETIGDLPAAAEFAFEQGAKQLLLLPEVGDGGVPRVGEDVLGRLSAWAEENHGRYPLAVSANAAEAIHAPKLPIGAGDDPSREFMHVDAAGMLKGCAFDGTGVRLSETAGVMDAVARLRESASRTSRGGDR